MDEIKVSILCNTYNHELYIRDTLEGFINQITTFKYEVLIHDDASTDKTASIIKEYEKKYPHLISPIYQTENKYSQGIKVSEEYQYHRIKGKYVALCEGDDFWIDKYKLQKQFDILEKNPEIDMCAHRAKQIDGRTGENRGYAGPGKESRLLSPNEVITGGGGFVSTASLFYRSELVKKALPEFRKILGLDYTLQIHGSLRGGILYLGDTMSVYRICTPGSWTERTRKVYQEKKNINNKIKKMLIQLNKETGYKYWKAILKVYVEALLRDLYCLYLRLIRCTK